jgi:hypothetical protein
MFVVLFLMFFISSMKSHALLIPEHEHEQMIKTLQNPLAHLISVPVIYDVNKREEGGNDQTVSARPVLPFKINSSWYLIPRAVLSLRPNEGLSDVETSLYLSPAQLSKKDIIWGVGGKGGFYKEGKAAYGPTAYLFKEQNGPIVFGFIAHYLSSSEIIETNLMMLFAYTFRSGYSLILESDDNYDGHDDVIEGDVTIGVQKIYNIGSESVAFGAGFRTLSHGPEESRFKYGFRFMVSYVFSK